MILPNKVALFTLAHRVPLLFYLRVFAPFQNPNNQPVFSGIKIFDVPFL